MLSSLVSKLSPKKLLAASISTSLAEFFHVDPELVESNLVQDAKVTLKGIEIKEQRLGGFSVYGTVGRIEFSWAWDAASFITDAKLTVQGVDIRVRLMNEEEQIHSSASPEPSTTLNPDEDVMEKSDWKAKYKQQIIDHLTLVVTDVLISIQLLDESEVVLEAKDMQLQTLHQVGDGRDEAASLMQEMGLGSIAVWIQDANSAKHSILDPFGYCASVQRISGRRFVDGLLSGLMVQGKPWTNIDSTHASSIIRVHAAKSQLVGLNYLQRVLQSTGNGKILTLGERNHENAKDSIEKEPEVPPPSTTSSVFRLPFQSIEIIFEDNVNLGLEGCEVRYCMDGTELSLHCSGGLWMNNTPISNNSHVLVDFAKSMLVLDTLPNQKDAENEIFYDAQSSIHIDACNGTDKEIARLPGQRGHAEFKFTLDLFQRFQSSILAILPESCHQAVTLVEQRNDSQLQSQPKLSDPTPWTLLCKQKTSFHLDAHKGAWVRATLTGLTIHQSQAGDGAPFAISCHLMRLDCSAGLTLIVPKVETNSKTLVCADRATAFFESIEGLMALKKMWTDVSSVIGSQSTTELMFNFSIPGLDMECSDPNHCRITLDGLHGAGFLWTLKSLQLQDIEGLSTEMSHIQASLKTGEERLHIREVKDLIYYGNKYLSSPMYGLELRHDQDSISISCSDLAVTYPIQKRCDPIKGVSAGGMSTMSLKDAERFAQLFRLQVQKLRLSINEGNMIAAQSLNVSLTLGSESIFGLSTGLVSGQAIDGSKFSCRGIEGKGTLSSLSQSSKSSCQIPFWKQFSAARLAIENVDTLVLPKMGHLHAPTENINVSLINSNVMVHCNSVKFCSTKLKQRGTQVSSSSSGILIQLSVQCKIKRLVLMPEFGPGKPGLCFDGLSLSCHLQESTTIFNAECNYIQGRGPNLIEFAVKQTEISAKKSRERNPVEITNSFGFLATDVTMVEISSFSVPGVFRLAKPLKNLTAHFTNGAIKSTISNVHVHCKTNVTKSQESGDGSARLPEWTKKLPPIQIQIRTGTVESMPAVDHTNEDKIHVALENSQLRIFHGEDDCLNLDVRLGSICGNKGIGGTFVASKLQLEASMHQGCCNGGELQSVLVPLLGRLQSAKMSCTEIETFHVPNYFNFQHPSRNIEAKFNNGKLSIVLQEINLAWDVQDPSCQKEKLPQSFNLPCKVNLFVFDLYMEDVLESRLPGRATTCKNLNLALEPALARIKVGKASQGAGVFLKCQTLMIRHSSSIVRIPKLSGSGLLQFNTPQIIGNLVIGLDKAQVEADFSSLEWSGFSSGKKQNVKVQLPFAAVPKFVLTLKCAGTLLSVEDAIITCDAFEGFAATTLDEMKGHYIKIVQERIPYILATKANIAGANIGDSVGMMAGSIVTNTNVIGATVGVAVRDAVGAAVSQGKAARGVDDPEKYKFGDFTRGLVASVKGAAKCGSAIRGDDNYEFGDLTAGTTLAAGSYVSENRMRLAGAGGSAAGMIAGAALLGPVGFVAGSFLGSSAAQSSVRTIVGEAGDNQENRLERSSANASNREHLRNHMYTTDLLSFDNQGSCSPNETEHTTTPVALNATARMVSNVATSEHRVVMAEAQVVDLLSSERATPMASPRFEGTLRSRQSTRPQTSASTIPAANTRPLGVNNNHSMRAASHYQVENLSSTQAAAYQLAAATPVAAASSRPCAQQAPAVPTHGNQEQSNSEQPHLNLTSSRSHSAAQDATNGNQQREGYRFGDFTRGVVARGRQLDGRDRNSDYKFRCTVFVDQWVSTGDGRINAG